MGKSFILGRGLLQKAVAVLLMLFLVACGGGSAGTSVFPGGGGAGTPTLTLSLSGATVSSSSLVTATASYKDGSGTPLSGQVIKFSFGTGGFAQTSPSALTDSNGNAVVTLTPASSGGSGADTLVATATYTPAATTTTPSPTPVAITAQQGFQALGAAGGAASLTMTLSSSQVLASAPVTVTVGLKDSTGNPVANQVISFSFKAGGLGQLSSGSSPATSALTDNTGQAVLTLTPANSNTSGADTLIASTTLSGGTPLTVSRGFSVSAGSSAAASLNLSLSSSTIPASGQVTATANLQDAKGVGIAGQVVSFALGGTVAQLNSSAALTDVNGNANVVLTPGTSGNPGADTLTATSTVNGNSIVSKNNFAVQGLSSSTASLTLSLSSATVTAASPATVSAVLKDGSGAPLVGQVVSFSTKNGFGALSATTALTNASGTASVSLSPASASSSNADSVTATAMVGGQTLTSSPVGFQLTATSVTIQSFSSDVPSGSALGANQQSTITVKLAGTVSTVPVQLNLTSQCAAFSPAKASVTPASQSVTTGVATFTYKDKGCGALQPTDTLQLSITGTTQQQSMTLALTSPNVASVIFVSASPSQLYLSSSGYSPTASTVTFQVNDGNGNGLPGKQVSMTPTTTVGGLTIDGQTSSGGVLPVVSKPTDSNGQVQVLMNSGSVPTPVAIVATYSDSSGTKFSSVSANLSIAVGLPTQQRFSLSQKFLNIEAYNVDNTPNVYTVFLADRLGNPVPPTTQVNIVNTMGQTQAVTGTNAIGGGLTVISANGVSGGQRPPNWDGRVTTLAYAQGEESFQDLKGTNLYDDRTPNPNYEDLGNPYLDPKFRGFYSADLQIFKFNGGGAAACDTRATTPTFQRFDGTNGFYGIANPGVPSQPNTCDTKWGKNYVRSAMQTIWATPGARPSWGVSLPSSSAGKYIAQSAGSCPSTRSLITGYQATAAGAPISTSVYDVDGSTLWTTQVNGSIGFLLADSNPVAFNPMANGTAVSAVTTVGLSATVAAGSTVGNALAPTGVAINYGFTNANSGTITFVVQSPSGTQSAANVNLILSPTLPAGFVTCP